MTGDDQDVLAEISAWMADHAGETLDWWQLHVTAPYRDGEAMAGWVDVQLDDLQSTIGHNWAWTVDGDAIKMLDTVDFGRDDGAQPYRRFDHPDGWRLHVSREDPTLLWVDHDVDIHTVRSYDGDVSEVIDTGRPLTVDQHAVIVRAYDEKLATEPDDLPRSYHVAGGWSARRLSEALSLWVKHMCGVDVTFRYVDEPDDTDLPEWYAVALERAAEIDAGTARTIPACRYRWLPDDAVDGERPQSCIWPSTAVATDPAGGKVPVCSEHADAARASGWDVDDSTPYSTQDMRE